MGAANVIPGVSGGTIAFITNIYERLINAIKAFDLSILKLLFKGELKAIIAKVDLWFLLAIFGGIGVSILTLAKALEVAFTSYETLTLSFFFGLILASIFAVGKQVSGWNFSVFLSLIIGIAIAAAIAFLPASGANDGFFYVLLCGVVAVCSMILPGLSGSYILLLMGNYILVLQSISGFNFGVLIPLALGCIIGLVVFSRLLSYLFERYKDQTIAILTGFVAGSLLIIWPWKSTKYLELADGKLKAIGYEWTIPTVDNEFFLALFLVILGIAIVLGIERLAKNQPTA